MAQKEITYYSVPEKGTAGNYNASHQFDYTDGYVGISEHGGLRVLLSPAQFTALVAFVAKHAPRARTTRKAKATR